MCLHHLKNMMIVIVQNVTNYHSTQILISTNVALVPIQAQMEKTEEK